MRIGLFTDTYFPQVSGVATSIRTLKEELEALGHEVYIFTTTDRMEVEPDPTIIRLPSVPFVFFKERRVAYRGLLTTYKLAKRYHLDIIHTQTEFGVGMLGKIVGKALRIPVVHTYHTHYEDYVDYIAKGMVIRPSMIKPIIRTYLHDLDGVICPSRIVNNILEGYEVRPPKRIIPTGIKLDKFVRQDISEEDCQDLRQRLGIAPKAPILLSLSRVSSEKNIQAVVKSLPLVLDELPQLKLIVAGDGPYLPELKRLAEELGLTDNIIFTGMVAPEEVPLYYKTCDFFISASTSETQGLTYIESLAAGRPIIAHGNPYLDDLVTDKMFGTLYYDDWDLSDAIVDALVNTPAMDNQMLQAKIEEISSQQFGKAVYAFYLDTIIAKNPRYHEKLSLTVAGSTSGRTVRLVRRTAHLPVTVVKRTAKTSSKVVKAPLKMVRAMKDFLE